MKQGLPPLIWPDSRVLILGSLPGDLSIAKQQYYVHPRNQFWAILARVFREDVPADYDGRRNFLRAKGLALWDVAHKAVREGSEDGAIRNSEPNDFIAFLTKHSRLRAIAFNGRKAEKMFNTYARDPRVTGALAPLLRQRTIYPCFPSSSPAHAKENPEQKAERWRVIVT
jgi:double-stranded uracil-DNA glycosylase